MRATLTLARAIRESETQWARAWAAKDGDKVVSHYADDALVELADVPIMSGKRNLLCGTTALSYSHAKSKETIVADSEAGRCSTRHVCSAAVASIYVWVNRVLPTPHANSIPSRCGDRPARSPEPPTISSAESSATFRGCDQGRRLRAY